MKKKELILEKKEYNIFSVKNDPISDRLVEIFEFHSVDFAFFDFRDFPPTDEQMKAWAEFESDDYPINYRNTLFKKNERWFKKAEEGKKYDWLREHYHVLNRPVVEDRDGKVLTIGGRPERILRNITGIDVSEP